MKTETLNLATNNGATTAFVALPDETTTKAVMLIHEYWGLTDHIKDIAGRYAAEGYIAIAPDLYRGKIAANPNEARELMGKLAIEDGLEIIGKTVEKAAETYSISSFGISGYCMGGTYALRAACESEHFHAAAPFYGDIPPENILAKLKTPVVFIAGTKDGWINPAKVQTELSEVADEHNLPVEVVTYEADHAFFNNTRPEVYNADAAEDAWAKVISLFADKL